MTEDGLVLGEVRAIDGSRTVARYDATASDVETTPMNAWVLERWADRVATQAEGAVEVALVDVEEHDGLQLAAILPDRREAIIAAPARGDGDE